MDEFTAARPNSGQPPRRPPPRWRRKLTGLLLVGGSMLALGAPATAGASITRLSFTATADTHVDAAYPNTSYGAKAMWVDSSPQRQAFMRFEVDGLEPGDTVTGARLRLYQMDNSNSGGRVFKISSNGWSEDMTYNTRPEIDGPQLGSFGAVALGNVYEMELNPPIADNGAVSLAIDSTSSDAAKWANRETGAKAPELTLEVDTGDRVADGLSQIAGDRVGSSGPTYYPTQHRMAVTESGRTLAVHGVHYQGPRLVWRDPAGSWQSSSRGDVSNGMMISGTNTGDWPASIALAEDSAGEQHAWVVFARANWKAASPVYLRRISDLDAPGGPSIGPRVEINAPQRGAALPDIAFEQTPGGDERAAVLWARRDSDETYETVAGWITDLDTDTPTVGDRAIIASANSSKMYSTLVPTPAGMSIAGRLGTSRLAYLSHTATQPLDSWVRHANGLSTYGYPSSTALDSGAVMSVIETSTSQHLVKVQRLSAAGVPQPAELTLSGYSMPAIVSDGARAWIVMVRQSDGFIVSRSFDPATGWSTTDRVEVGPEGGTPLSYPNTVRETDGRLRFVFEGISTTSRSAVFAFQRPL